MKVPYVRVAGEFFKDLSHNITPESALRTAGHVALLTAVAYGASGFMEDGYPDKKEIAQINACANHLDEETQVLTYESMDKECKDFKDDLRKVPITYGDNVYDRYVLPSKEVFLQEQIYTSHIEEERKNKFIGSFSWLFVALGCYTTCAAFRRIEENEVVAAAESILKSTNNDK